MIDTFEVKSFLCPAECAALRAELRQAAGAQATVLSRDPGGEVRPLVRRSTRMSVPARTAEQIKARLMQQTHALEQRLLESTDFMPTTIGPIFLLCPCRSGAASDRSNGQISCETK